MADMITPNFSRAEMSCRCGCGLDYMDEKFMKMLQQLRNQLGPLPVTLAVRCEKQGGSDFLELVSPRKAINPPGSFTWIY